MTLAVVVLIIFLMVSSTNSSKKKNDKKTKQKNTITNVELQDKLWIENYKKIFEDLEKMELPPSDAEEKNPEWIMNAIENLFVKYDIPDLRSPATKQENMDEHCCGFNSRTASDRLDRLNYNDRRRKYEEPELPYPPPLPGLYGRIWYKKKYIDDLDFTPPLENMALIYGDRFTYKEVNGIRYKYDSNGWLEQLRESVPAKLIADICDLMTTRQLYEQGFNFSPTRIAPYWQREKDIVKEHEERKAKYPWLYGEQVPAKPKKPSYAELHPIKAKKNTIALLIFPLLILLAAIPYFIIATIQTKEYVIIIGIVTLIIFVPLMLLYVYREIKTLQQCLKAEKMKKSTAKTSQNHAIQTDKTVNGSKNNITNEEL